MKLTITFILTLIFCASIIASARASNPGVGTGKVVQARTSKHHVRRDLLPVTFEIDGVDYHFNFEMSTRRVVSNDIPVWLVKSKPSGTPNYTYKRVPHTERILPSGHFYVDNAKKAVAFVHYDEKNGDILYDGLFGDNENVHLINSLPESQKEKLQRSRQQGNHVIHRTQRKDPYLLSNREQEKRNKRSYKKDPRNEKLAKPLDVLYPKLLVLVDNRLFQCHKSDISAIVKYVATFWNKVDQKFVELDSIDVQLSVTGIIIANDENAFNFVNMGKLDPKIFGEDHYWPDFIFEHMRMYFHYNFSKDADFQNYDAAVLMTALDTHGVAGVAHLKKICSNWYNEMIVHDEGWFDGVHTASHELAHTIGAEHDSFNEAQSGECSARDSNNGVSVMATRGEAGDYFYWSECSKRSFREFTKVKASECLATRYRERHFTEDDMF